MALLYCDNSFRLAIENKKIVTAALLDLSKAFDSIKHTILKEKLITMKFSENAVKLLIDFITDRRQQTFVNNVKSDWIICYQGVPQGTELAPLLLNIFMNDLSKNIASNCKIFQYADDTLIFTEQKDLQQCLQNFEESCNLAHQYFNMHPTNSNAEKTELTVFTKKNKNTTEASIKTGDKIIASKKLVKFLDIMVNSHLNFQEEVKKILKRMISGIKTIAAILKPFDIQTRIILLQALVFSHLHYSSSLLSGISRK